jgi:membrane protein DedA with SNARE-associated domain
VLAIFSDFVIQEITRYGYVAVFLLMVLESACVPIPSEVTMLFGGALASAAFSGAGRELDFVTVALVGAFGNLLGSWLAYWVGRVGGRPLIDRWGRYLLLRPHEVDRAHDWFERYGQATVFFGRLLPVIRTFISLPAGVVRMDLKRFTFYTVLGCLPWCLLLTWLGYKLGERWDEVERFIRPFSWAIVVAVVAGVGWFVWHRLRTIRAEETERAAAERAPSEEPTP